MEYRDGTDLILSVGGKALGHSTGCKISYKAETGTRKTKEAAAGKWDEKYVKSLGVTITADGFVHGEDTDNNLPTLESLFMAHVPVDASCRLTMRARPVTMRPTRSRWRTLAQ